MTNDQLSIDTNRSIATST